MFIYGTCTPLLYMDMIKHYIAFLRICEHLHLTLKNQKLSRNVRGKITCNNTGSSISVCHIVMEIFEFPSGQWENASGTKIISAL